jgi:ketosteroid isomerase-like protein
LLDPQRDSGEKGGEAMFEGMVQKQFDRAQNRLDVAAIMAMWNDDAVFEFPGRSAVSGRFQGRDALEAWWRRWVARYARARFTVRHVGIVSLWPRVTLIAWDFEGTTDDGIRVETSGVTLARARGGKISYAKDYLIDPRALEAVWGRASTGRKPPPPRLADSPR